jgi:PleD family two-component response regulator
VGVATAQASDILQSLIDRAEQALQVAQVGGRNRVVTVDAAA